MFVAWDLARTRLAQLGDNEVFAAQCGLDRRIKLAGAQQFSGIIFLGHGLVKAVDEAPCFRLTKLEFVTKWKRMFNLFKTEECGMSTLRL